MIENSWKDRLYQYITGIIQKNGHKLIAINGMPDHLHILFGLKPTQSLSDLLQDVKGDSSKWINKNRLSKNRFYWQPGFGAFSHSISQIPVITRYIENQENHHRKKTFMQEYRQILNSFNIDFDERYIFKEIINEKQPSISTRS